jgi:hypothetical protein
VPLGLKEADTLKSTSILTYSPSVQSIYAQILWKDKDARLIKEIKLKKGVIWTLALNRCKIAGELYFMLLVTCAVKPLTAISQNRMHQNTRNKMKQKSKISITFKLQVLSSPFSFLVNEMLIAKRNNGAKSSLRN